MGRESLQGSSVHGASLASRAWNARHFARQRGAGVVEYMLISGFMLGALLTPFGEDDENALQRLVHAIRGQQDAYNYSAKLPVMPTFDADGKLVGGDESPQEEPGPPPATDDSDEEASDGDDDAADQPDEGADDDASADEGSDSEGESSSDDASNGEGGGQDASEGGGSGGGGSGGGPSDVLENLEELAKDISGPAAAYKFASAVGQYMCGQMEEENPVWTQEDLLAYQAAEASYHRELSEEDSYARSKESFAQFGIEYPGKEFLSGFSATLYRMDGTWVLAFRGTDTRSDHFHTNLPQGILGHATQYDYAVQLAEKLQAELDGDFLIAGHSLGGGLAQAAAYETGMDAITFNAAGLRGTYKEEKVDGEEQDLVPGSIRNHFIHGEILTTLQVITPGMVEADGVQIAHSAPCDRTAMTRHGMDQFNPPDKPGLERSSESATDNAQHNREVWERLGIRREA